MRSPKERRIVSHTPPGEQTGDKPADLADEERGRGLGFEPGAEDMQELASLSDILLPGEIKHRIRDYKRLLILPAGDISTVPFAALPVGDMPLVEFVLITMLADVSGLLFPFSERYQMGWRNIGLKAVIVGDPDLSDNRTWIFRSLPHAKLEAERVANVLGARLLFTGSAATKDKVSEALRHNDSARLLYFATHGIANSRVAWPWAFLLGVIGLVLNYRLRSKKLAAPYNPPSVDLFPVARQDGRWRELPDARRERMGLSRGRKPENGE